MENNKEQKIKITPVEGKNGLYKIDMPRDKVRSIVELSRIIRKPITPISMKKAKEHVITVLEDAEQRRNEEKVKETEYWNSMDDLSFNTCQTKSHETAIYLDKLMLGKNIPDDITNSLVLSYIGLGLGEVGEIQNKIKKVIRDDAGKITEKFVTDIKKELGDVLWYVAETCTALDLNMEDVASDNLKKLQSRQKRNVLTGSGDNR